MKEIYRNDASRKNSGISQDTTTKLKFTDGAEDSVLVFEHEQVPKPKKEQTKQKTVGGAAEKAPEFELPEKYTVNQKYNSSRMIVDEAPRVRAAYMPKFTEASENYRVVDEKRPRRKFTVKDLSAKAKDGEEANYIDKADPTSESVENTEGVEANVVTVGDAAEDTEGGTKIFKFEKPKSEEEKLSDVEESGETSEERGFVIVSDELSADAVFAGDEINYEMINSAKGGGDIAEAADSQEEETVVSDEPSIDETVSEPEEKEEPEEYKIPDPEPIVIDVPTPGEVKLESKIPEQIMEEPPEDIGDAPQVGKTVGAEYTSPSQRDSFKDKFLDTIMSIKVRLFASVALALVALIVENLYLFDVSVPALMGMSRVSEAMAIIDLPIVICLFVLALPEVFGAFKRLFLGRATPELFIPSAFLVAVVYYTTVILYKPAKFPLFGLIFAIFTIGAISATLFKKLADFSNFKAITANAEKRIVDRKLTRTLAEESFAVDGKVESYKSKTARLFRVSFVSDFFKRSGKCSENSSNVLLVLAATFGFAFVGAAIAFFIPGDIDSAVMTFATVFMFGIPVFTLLSHKLPFYHSSVEAMYENSAVIGESSLYDYSGIDVVTFQDTEVFGDDDVNLQRVALYGKNENLSKAMHQMAALFAVVGGPLDRLFSASIDQRSEYAVNVVIDMDGISGEIWGKDVRAGNRDYMQRCGIAVPEETNTNPPYSTTKIMYAAEDGVVYAKFCIRYTLSEEFTMQLPSLSEEGIVPLIYTRDPNVNEDLLRALTAGSKAICVLKKLSLPTDDKLYHRVSAGLVTTGDKTNVLNMLLMSKKYVRFQARTAITEITAMLVGSILAVILSLGSMVSLIPSVLFAVWQITWCVVLFYASKRALRTNRRVKKKKE